MTDAKSVEEAAIEYIGQGFAVVPLKPKDKAPEGKGWPDRRYRPEEVPRAFGGGRNIGLVLGEPSKDLIDIDADCDEAVNVLLPFFDFAYFAQCGRGGRVRHLFGRCPGVESLKLNDPIRLQSKDEEERKNACIIEIRSTGGQTMVPPSTHPSGQPIEWYSSTNFPAIDADRLKSLVQRIAALTLIIRYWPGDGSRQDAAMCIAGALLRTGWADEEIDTFWKALIDNIPDDEPAMRDVVLDYSRKRVAKGKNTIGLQRLKDQKMMPDDVVDKIREWLGIANKGLSGNITYFDVREEMLAKHFVVNRSGAMVVMTKKWHPKGNRFYWETQSFSEFVDSYRNKLVMVPSGNQMVHKNQGRAFLDDPSVPYYQGLVLDTEGSVEDWLNLWQGFSVGPAPGDWSMFRTHILENICRGNAAQFDYLIGWLAWKVQNPDRVPGVAIVIRGRKGTGKNVFAETFGQLFGQHYFITETHEQVMGRFSGHLRDCCLLVADEAFWAGDTRHEGILKGLITSERRGVEDKGLRAELADNHLGLIVLSNADYVVPATEGERRFAVFDIGDAHMQDHTYFRSMREQMDRGGLAAMLHDLMAMDLTGFEVRRAPQTSGLLDQKLENAPPFLQWLVASLTQMQVASLSNVHDRPRVFWEEDAKLVVRKTDVVDAYRQWRKEMGIKAKSENEHKIGHLIKMWMNYPGQDHMVAGRKWDGAVKKQVKVYNLPDLLTAREMIEQHLGGEIDWGSDTVFEGEM